MVEPLILLDKRRIKTFCKKYAINTEIYETLPSTNDYLKTRRFCDKKNRLCLAEQQTQGRGRFQRHWHSPRGENIYFSLGYRFEKAVNALDGLSIVVGLAVHQLLQTYVPEELLKLKWPNDVLYAEKKLAGILIEIQPETHDICYAIIGIGINVNMLWNNVQAITQPWTSVREIYGQYIDRNAMVEWLVVLLMDYLAQFKEQGLSLFINAFHQADFLWEKPVTLAGIKNIISGVANGITEKGHLQVKMADGNIKCFSSGEITLQKK